MGGFWTELFWHAYATLYDSIWDHDVTRQTARAIEAHLPDGGAILEVGAGTGLITREFAHRASVTATEPNHQMMARLRARGLPVTTLEVPMADVPSPDGPHVVVAANVLHLTDAVESSRQLERLAAGGLVVIATPRAGLTGAGVAAAVGRHDSWATAVKFVLLHQLLAPLTLLSRSALAPTTHSTIEDFRAAVPAARLIAHELVAGVTEIAVFDLAESPATSSGD